MSRRKEYQKESARKALRMMVLILQLGITMMTSILLTGLIGWFIVQKTGKPIIFPLFLIVGIMAGFRSCYQVIIRFTSLKNPEGYEGGPFNEYEEEDEEDSDGGPQA